MNTVLTIFVVIASISLVLSSSIPQYGKSVYLAQISPQLFELPLK
jgi:hypothetical protein